MKGDVVQHKLNIGKWEWSGSVGKKIVQFNDQNPVTPLSNSISTLFYGINPMKIYEKTFFDLQYQRSWESGFKMKLSTHYADRNPLNNSSDFSFVKDSRKKFTINDAITKNTDSGFLKHQAVYATVEISVSPGQQFIQFPNRKVSIGTKYPTFTARYSKGIPSILSSDVNFDKWEFEVQDDMKLKLLGLLKYKLN
jgi:hypothetical protein